MTLPENCVIRLNMAWYSSSEIEVDLSQIKNDIFMDVPIGRKKPPMNRYSMNEIEKLIGKYEKIKYLAISNVNEKEDLLDFLKINCQIIPKIESLKGIGNIKEILSCLPYKNKIIMLDHEDLYNDLLTNKKNPELLYSNYIDELKKNCKESDCCVLQTAGIVFSEISK